MKWDRIRNAAGLVWVVFLPLWWIDFVVYLVVSLLIGGNYFYGYAEDGRYFLALGRSHDRHPLTEVSAEVYYYSVYHHASTIALELIFGPAFLIWAIAGSICRRRLPVTEVCITATDITLDGEPASIDRVMEALKGIMAIDADRRPRIRIKNDYEGRNAPQHAVAFQLALMDNHLLLQQEPPRGQDGVRD